MTGHRYLDTQCLYDALEYITVASSINDRFHDAALPEMNMQGSYPECDAAKLYTLLDTTYKNDSLRGKLLLEVK